MNADDKKNTAKSPFPDGYLGNDIKKELTDAEKAWADMIEFGLDDKVVKNKSSDKTKDTLDKNPKK